MKKIFFVIVFILAGLLYSSAAYATAWPSSLTRHNDILMPAPYEPSGLAWNPVTNKLFTVSDKGKITMMDMDGSNQDTRNMTSYMDFEAITIADPTTNKVYIGDENPDSVIEYDWQTKILTGKSWNLTNVMTGADNSGLEGLAFVPNGYHPYPDSASGGIFYAGIQRAPILNDGNANNDYLIYAFDIDLNTSGKIVKWWGIPVAPNTPTSDISDLYFSKDTGILYVLYDGANRLIEMKTDGTVIKDYSNVPVADQEGLVIKTNYPSLTADVYLGSDSTRLIGWYSGYPVDYDFDRDGVKTSLDCNDKDNTVWTKQTYYKDADGDGLGFGVAESICSSVPPIGYVSNSNDKNDNDYDNDGVNTDSDCNDKDITVWENKTYYKDADGDGVGTGIAESFCSLTAPVGYVSTSGVDCNDNDKTVWTLQTYYQDSDKDGLGSDVTTFVCSLNVPAGYVANSDDLNDNDFDNDNVITSLDCNDKDSIVWENKTFYKDADGDGVGTGIAESFCFSIPPSGYTSNSGVDCNDNDYTVFAEHTYYKDHDGDGLGSKVASRTNPIILCSLVPPTGYVSNNSDRNDNDYDNDGIIMRFDCDDTNPLYFYRRFYYQDNDGDGLGNRRKRNYFCVPPARYVINFKDKNDNHYDSI